MASIKAFSDRLPDRHDPLRDTVPGTSTVLHMAEVCPKGHNGEDSSFILIGSTRTNWGKPKWLSTLYKNMNEAAFSKAELDEISKKGKDFHSFYCKETKDKGKGKGNERSLDPTVILKYRTAKGSGWNPLSWPPSFAIEIPSLIDRKPCGMCCATTNFRVGLSRDPWDNDLLKLVASDCRVEKTVPREDRPFCSEEKNTATFKRLEEEQWEWKEASIGFFHW